jgi:hypothetical protein
MRIQSAIAIVATFAFALTAGAQTSKPAEDKVDLSSPKAAMKTFMVGLMHGKADNAKKAAIASEDENKFIDQMAGAMGSFKKLEDAAKEKFGEEGAKLSQMGGPGEKQIEMMDSAEEQIDGDSATVTSPGPDKSKLPLKKVGEEWKVDVANMPNMQQMKMVMPMFEKMQKLADDFAADIKAGKFATVTDAQTEFQTRMMNSLGGPGIHAPTTVRSKAATAPAQPGL